MSVSIGDCLIVACVWIVTIGAAYCAGVLNGGAGDGNE